MTKMVYDPIANKIQSVTITGVASNVEATVSADAYVIAIPVDQITNILFDGSANMKQLLLRAPSISNINKLQTAWMAGLQYYLTVPTTLGVLGQVGWFDSPWSLTGVSELQLWPGYNISDKGDGKVKAVVSVIISEWDKEDQLGGKKAKDCTSAQEIQLRTWNQMGISKGCQTIFPNNDQSTLDCFHLDDGITFDPATKLPQNSTPLFVTEKDTSQYRPQAITEVPNLFLAGDYVITSTDVGLMEGANESGRRAAMGVISLLDPLTALYNLPNVQIHNVNDLNFLLNLPNAKTLDDIRFTVFPNEKPQHWDFPVPSCKGGKHVHPEGVDWSWEGLKKLYPTVTKLPNK